MIVAQCLTCQAFVEHDVRHLNGCNCDPDAPTWVWCERDGRIRGLSNAKWRTLTETDNNADQ